MSHIFSFLFLHESVHHHAHFIGMVLVQSDVVPLFITGRVNRCDFSEYKNVFEFKQVILCK